MEIVIMKVQPAATYDDQLAGRAAELLPGVDADLRLELLDLMDGDDARSCLAWLISAHPEIFDHSLVRDRNLVDRLFSRLDDRLAADDEPEPCCAVCGASVGIFIGRGDAWLHYTGEGTAASPVQLFDAGHEPVIAWREAGER
jgi:hypothetical protein